MKPKIEEIFEMLLIQIQKGRRVEDCLKDHPEYREELEPLLLLSCQLNGLPKTEPDRQAVESAMSRVRRIVYEQREMPKQSFLKLLVTGHPALYRIAASIILALLVLWGGISFSAQSRPGNFLYPVKRWAENARYNLTFTPDGRTELHIVFARNRTGELFKTFRSNTALDKRLLNLMLNETRYAQKGAEKLTGANAAALMDKVEQINRLQKSTLEDIQSMACAADSAILNTAISLCAQRGDCLTRGCCSECRCGSEPCACPWETICVWK